MNKLEKLFTIADIAEMTSLSDRSIRNYLRNGLLTGQKVGGQWRFTSQDIMNFFHRSDVSASVNKQWKLDILDFIDGVNPASEGERQACTVVDLYLSREEADACNEKVSDYFPPARPLPMRLASTSSIRKRNAARDSRSFPPRPSPPLC